MTIYKLQYPKSGVKKARAQRRTATDAGRKLWSKLRNNQLGVHFRREVPQGPYICDFLCVQIKLIVEVDGGQHATSEGKEHDEKRDAFLRKVGYEVLRFSDRDVLTNIQGVLQKIYETVEQATHSPHL